MRTAARNLFTTIRTEGALLPADFLQHVAEGNREIEGLSPDSYHLVPGEKLNEAINRSWNRLLGAWTGFKDASEKLGVNDLSTGLTRERWLLPLFQELGYGRLQTEKAFEIDGKSYPISHKWQKTPIHLVGCKIDLDRRTSGVPGAARTSPHGLVQEMLNRSEVHRWGFVSNGYRLRVLRDNITLTRQAYVEFDLAAMFDGEVYADFVVLWLLSHQSRVEGERPELCWLEKWSQLAEKRGTRVLEDLRTGVESAINALGSGFLGYPANRDLRNKLSSGTLNSQEYYRQLLRVVYRILFLFVAEDRGLLFEPKSNVAARELYSRFYSVARLRRLAEWRVGTQHADLWRGLTLVFEKLDTGCAELALPALGSFLWSREATTEIAGCELANRDLLKAIHSLAFTVDGRVRRLVDYKNLGSEELGSIYEALLELHPQLNVDAATFTLSTAAGNERKTTGSYYTPTSLVNCLLDSALNPVLDEACKKPNPEQAILDLKVCDPATGSGHFLIAAAHRLAKRLAAVRTGDEEPSPEATRAALRDLIGRCLYGVDLNPMAVELCKVSLWLEALEPGKPLSFLDHRIKVGNSLLGATPALIEKGIPDEAFTVLEGDDKTFVAALKRANKAARERSNMLLFSGEIIWQALARVKAGVIRLEAIEDDTLDDIHAKEAEFDALMKGGDYQDQKLVADAWCAAFTVLKTREAEFRLTEEEFSVIMGNPRACPEATRTRIKAEAEAHTFFHWHLEFPDVFDVAQNAEKFTLGWSGGFNVVLGNPPWDKLELKEKEWFAVRNAEIAKVGTAAKRKRLIQALEHTDRGTFDAYRSALRKTAVVSVFVRKSGCFPLCGIGNTNSYALFAELFRTLSASLGLCGLVIPSGIASDDSTKEFISDTVRSKSLVSMFDFENKGIFPGVHNSFKFCLLTTGSGSAPVADRAQFVCFAHGIEDLSDPTRRYTLSAEEISLLNPNTLTCPIFRSVVDAELNKTVYRRVPVFIQENDPGSNRWRATPQIEMLHMSHASHLFETRDTLEADGWHLNGNSFYKQSDAMLPLYEAKMFHHFNHRWATFQGEDWKDGLTRINDPWATAIPRYWVPADAFRVPAGLIWKNRWLLAYRNIARTTDERTFITTVLPSVACSNSIILIYPGTQDRRLAPALIANLSSLCLDYCARQKIGGTNLTLGYLRQLPVISPEIYSGYGEWLGGGVLLRDWILSRALELIYTAWDLKSFSEDCAYDGPPFQWNEERRFLLRCELDAAFFHLYLGSAQEWANQPAAFREIFPNPRTAASYIMDTFPIVRKRDEQEHGGKYRTKDTILEIYDEMAEAARTGVQYRTRLNPPPADPSVAHSAEGVPVLGVS